jgi:PAS domain S-box-containing protein
MLWLLPRSARFPGGCGNPALAARAGSVAQGAAMTLPHKLAALPQRPVPPPIAGPARAEVAPALFRLLSESALARAALDACGLPLALAEAGVAQPALCYVNRAFESFFGYRAAEALGRPAAALLFPEDAATERLFREPGAQLVLRARRKDGSPAHVEITAAPVRGVDGRVTHWVLAFADRTELERLRDALARLGQPGPAV